MSDESKAHDLGVLSTSPHIESPSTFALAGDDANAPNPANLAKSKGGTPSSSKKKRGRKASVQNNRPPSAGPDSEDINFHVEAGWSEDEADAKEHPAKRVATTADKDAAAAALAKRATGPLSNFTVRAVVTRKDIEVVFGQEKDKQALLEAQTSTKIEIITGKDDPDIVVDRVLSIKGPIDGVAAAYKDVVESLRKANAASTAPAATVSATAVTASASPPAPTESPSAEADEASKGALPTGNAEPGVDTNANASAADETTQLESPTKEGAASSSVATTVKAASNVCVILRLLVPHRCVGSIMGHSGRTINNIRDVTSVSIHTSEATLPISTERIVEISGSPESIQRAIVLIAEALTRDMASYTSADLYVPAACLPSAMTVEINNRKRKDGKRPGNADQYSGNRGQAGIRGSGARNGGGYGQNRGQGGSGHNAGNSMSGGMNNRGDRYGRHGERQGDRYSDRSGGRNRGPNSTSQVNRVPVGGGGNNNRSQGNMNHHNNNSGGYRSNNQLAPSRNAAPPTLNYGGYAVPAPTLYPTYVVPNAAATGHIGGVVPPAMRYGGAVGAMAPGPARGAYGDSYNGAPSSYQYPAPAAYGYGVPPAAQGMYGGASEQSPNAPYSQAYPERNNRQQMPQPSMPMGGNSGNLPMGGGGGAPPGAGSQTIQQIYVPGDKIGAVIGRRGETINEIRRTTNAHVDIQDSGPGAKQRLIIITGGYDQVRSAYYMIKNKVDMARPAVHS
ncbi:RNA binding protein, heterogenous nuclear RNP-K like protein [Coemansia sp. IMI 209128]|nr:RNA binding protein, heterogenous nuclear RNP-K like protein [Coemansia sp. RSA 2530]KAJ2703666.1 RNA binding protein, heterogenous nuclear RNP-K like protein [Coemansia sp. IMI 209128]